MATYNGARFLSEQLDSLSAQERLPYELVVCDDGSTDESFDILENFARTAAFPVHIHRNVANLGYSDNFLKAARLCKGDWVSFCDQDDVWLPSKLSDCAKAIGRHADLTMVLQNAELCDMDLSRRGRVFPNKVSPGVYGPNRQFGFWVWPGFVKTVRAALFHEVDTLDRPLSYAQDYLDQTHDKWTCMVANALGGIAVLREPAALYRRHEAAVTGAYYPKALTQRVSDSLRVGADHYDFLSTAALSSADYLERAAATVTRPGWSDRFVASAAKFGRMRQIMAARARLYRDSSARAKARTFLDLLRQGAYFGDPFTAMGWRSAAKDFCVMFRGSGL